MTFRPCIVIPTYNNPETIRTVVMGCRAHVDDVLVIDDGSDAPGRDAVAALGTEGLARIAHRSENGGKGAAVKTGMRLAAEAGFTHALQVDADCQHTLDDIPRFLDSARQSPQAVILGAPRFDDTVPTGRRVGRLITVFWVHIETLGRVIEDPMCGFRVYPVESTLAVLPAADFMDFDPELAVRLVWAGVPVVNLATRVRYLSAEEGGVSNFHMVRDNVRISWMHTRLVCIALLRIVTGRHWRKSPWRPAGG